MNHSLAALAEQLAANSDPYRDPSALIDWGRLTLDDWWLPPAAVSLAGLADYDAAPQRLRIRLSQYEWLGCVHTGLALERLFIQQASVRLDRLAPGTEYAYLLHEIREEAGHSLMFLKLVAQSGLVPFERGPEWTGLARALARIASRNGLLYWFAMVLAEDVPDKLNRRVRREDCAGMSPVIRQMATLHAVDEARHLAFARGRLAEEMAACGPVARALWPRACNWLFGRFVRAYFWPQSETYELAGFARGARWRARALASPARRAFVRQVIAPTVRLFDDMGINLRLP